MMKCLLKDQNLVSDSDNESIFYSKDTTLDSHADSDSDITI